MIFFKLLKLLEFFFVAKVSYQLSHLFIVLHVALYQVFQARFKSNS